MANSSSLMIAAASVAVILLMGHVLLNVASRNVFNLPLPGTTEIVAYWYMPAIAFSGLVIAQLYNRHISAPVLFDSLPFRVQHEIVLCVTALSAAMSFLFAWFTADEAIHSAEIGRRVVGVAEVVIWPATFFAPLAFAGLAVLFGSAALAAMRCRPEAVPANPHRLPLTIPSAETGRRRVWIVRLAIAFVLAGTIALLLMAASREAVGSYSILLMLVLLSLRVPVAFALAVPGLVGLYMLAPRSVFTMLKLLPYETTATWELSAIPMFVFMGLLLSKSGLTKRLYFAAQQWLNYLPGGLAVATNVAGTGLAAVSGSTIGTTYALARMAIPEMLCAGYDRRIAVGSVMVAGLPGQLIPPSTFLIIYAGIASVPVGPQLLAGVGPGLLVSLAFSLSLVVAGLLWRDVAGGNQNAIASSATWSLRWRALREIWPLPIFIGVVLGGIYSGVLTATEAGAAGALCALVLTLTFQGYGAVRAIINAIVETTIATGSIFFMLIGSVILSSLLTLSGVADGFTQWIAVAELSRIQFLLVVLGLYLILGTFLEPLPMVLLTAPLLFPVLAQFDVSLIWFGVFVVFMSELAILTPPVGILSFIIHNIVKEESVNMGQRISMGDINKAVYLLMPTAIIVAVLLICFPEIATWLPEKLGGNVGP